MIVAIIFVNMRWQNERREVGKTEYDGYTESG